MNPITDRTTNKIINIITVMPWAELVDQCEKIYDIVLGLDRHVKDMLIQNNKMKENANLLDIPSKELFEVLKSLSN